jgi:hypothetical protein
MWRAPALLSNITLVLVEKNVLAYLAALSGSSNIDSFSKYLILIFSVIAAFAE